MNNRIIKFRAWNKDFKTMGRPFTLQDAIGSREVNGVNTCGIDYMQFTGLIDKNGKEIYEGDILQYIDGDNSPELYQVIFSNGNFILASLEDAEYDEYIGDFDPKEVIGNIYENPELLK